MSETVAPVKLDSVFATAPDGTIFEIPAAQASGYAVSEERERELGWRGDVQITTPGGHVLSAGARVARLELDFVDDDIGSIVWATGYRPDYSWLDVPVLDHKGRIRHDGGVTEAPGLYVTGLNVLRRRNRMLNGR